MGNGGEWYKINSILLYTFYDRGQNEDPRCAMEFFGTTDENEAIQRAMEIASLLEGYDKIHVYHSMFNISKELNLNRLREQCRREKSISAKSFTYKNKIKVLGIKVKSAFKE